MHRHKRDAVIVAYGRSAMAKAKKGSLAYVHPVDYGSQVIRGILAKLPKFDYALIDDVISGTAMPQGYVGFNIGRLLAQAADLPDDVPGQTVNRFCASGLQAIATAANAIRSGDMDIVIAGGVERMTGIYIGQPDEYKYSPLDVKKPGTYMFMGITAENVAEQFNITRKEMDAMAVESHRRAAAAQAAGKFTEEIIPITIKKSGEEQIFVSDEGIRPGSTLESLSSLKPCFKDGGNVTAATSSQMTDGAAFVVMMARETAEKLACKPIATFMKYVVSGVPSEIMGIGPSLAIPQVMAKAGLNMDDIDVIELNEAFASQAIYCIRKLDIPTEKVNPNGGALALGHPLGATGAFLTCKILSELKRRHGNYGLVSMCVGGGMGAAGIYKME